MYLGGGLDVQRLLIERLGMCALITHSSNGLFLSVADEGIQENGIRYLMDVLVQVSKPVLKTRTFQEDCVSGVVEQLTEHLAQNSYSVAFPELAVVPLVQLRRLTKGITVDRFRKQFKQLVEQVIPTL